MGLKKITRETTRMSRKLNQRFSGVLKVAAVTGLVMRDKSAKDAQKALAISFVSVSVSTAARAFITPSITHCLKLSLVPGASSGKRPTCAA